jgi:hypothetical protein
MCSHASLLNSFSTSPPNVPHCPQNLEAPTSPQLSSTRIPNDSINSLSSKVFSDLNRAVPLPSPRPFQAHTPRHQNLSPLPGHPSPAPKTPDIPRDIPDSTHFAFESRSGDGKNKAAPLGQQFEEPQLSSGVFCGHVVSERERVVTTPLAEKPGLSPPKPSETKNLLTSPHLSNPTMESFPPTFGNLPSRAHSFPATGNLPERDSFAPSPSLQARSDTRVQPCTH